MNTRSPLWWLVLGAAAAGATLTFRPAVSLRETALAVDAGNELVLRHLQATLGVGADVLAHGKRRVIRRFTGAAGPFPHATVELVDFDHSSVSFEHLRGPFAACQERIDVQATPAGSLLVHTGRFSIHGGLCGLLGIVVVRPAFEEHVREHLLQT